MTSTPHVQTHRAATHARVLLAMLEMGQLVPTSTNVSIPTKNDVQHRRFVRIQSGATLVNVNQGILVMASFVMTSMNVQRKIHAHSMQHAQIFLAHILVVAMLGTQEMVFDALI